MTPAKKCPKCGGDLAAGAAAGLCLKCLAEASQATVKSSGATLVDTAADHTPSPGPTVQFFGDYEELFQKVKGQGETALARIAKYKGLTGIRIPMSYGLALIDGYSG